MPETLNKPLRYHFLFINIVLAIVIFYAAEIGRLMGMPDKPLAISVIWPAAGFSLAALLLFGFKVWPGIFLGNLSYNILHLYASSPTSLFTPMIVALIVSFGALLQALVGAYIMKRFASRGYFNTVRDIIIFLIPASLLTCLISCTIGVTTLAIYEQFFLPFYNTLHLWVTFWIGDSIGVYLFTPLLVVWSTQRPHYSLKKYGWEILSICLLFLFLVVLTSLGYRMAHLFIPICMWSAYRFGMHGATLSIIFVALAFIVPTSLGYGVFVHVPTSLVTLVSYLLNIVAITLLFAAVINERESILNLLEDRNIYLGDAVEMYIGEVRGLHDEIFVRKKLDALELARKVKLPLIKMSNFIKASKVALSKLQDILQTEMEETAPSIAKKLLVNLKTLEDYLSQISTFKDKASKIVNTIQEQSEYSLTSEKPGMVSIDLNSLLHKCLAQATVEELQRHPDFTFNTVRSFDKKIHLTFSLPEDIAHAFLFLFAYAYSSLYGRYVIQGDTFSPFLELQTINHEDHVEILIRDNGLGVPESKIKDLFQQPETPDLSLAYDIIVHVHKGEIQVESKEMEYLSFLITLPKQSIKPT